MNYCPLCGVRLVVRSTSENRVQTCPKCDFTNWDNPAPVTTSILLRGGRLVLVRSRTRGNEWGFPSGFVERDERAEDALVREVKEETNLSACVLGFLGTYPIDTGRKRILLIAYEAIATEGSPAPNSEISEIAELEPAAALNLLKGREERSILSSWMERAKAKPS